MLNPNFFTICGTNSIQIHISFLNTLGPKRVAENKGLECTNIVSRFPKDAFYQLYLSRLNNCFCDIEYTYCRVPLLNIHLIDVFDKLNITLLPSNILLTFV